MKVLKITYTIFCKCCKKDVTFKKELNTQLESNTLFLCHTCNNYGIVLNGIKASEWKRDGYF